MSDFDVRKLSYEGLRVLSYLAFRAREVELRGAKDELWSPLINQAIEEMFEQLPLSLRSCVFKNFADDKVIDRWLAIHFLRYPDDKSVFDALYVLLNKQWINSDPQKMYQWHQIAEHALVPFLVLQKEKMKPHYTWWFRLFKFHFSFTCTVL